jgi:exodeoxyribonuclease VII large subunit
MIILPCRKWFPIFNFGMMNEKLKLSELNGLVKKSLSSAFPVPVWVIGEISELKINQSGHCYLMLVEKEENSDRIVAQAKATIWSYTYRMLRPYFETTTGQTLTEGLKVLVSASVEFHELYGYSLNIRDIDPTYTLGDMAQRRREIIRRLTEEGVVDMNKEIELPFVPQKIAVISSPTAAGYEDFIDQLKNNRFGYAFHAKLFPAVMQGVQAESSIISALDLIYQYEDFFDVVVIIRGGGSTSDLSCFDNYNLAYHITQFPIPVLTGIGHEKDDSIVDLVAHTRLKTPTAVAEFLISGATNFEANLEDLEKKFVDQVQDILSEERNRIDRLAGDIPPIVREQLTLQKHSLLEMIWKMKNNVKLDLKSRDHQLDRRNRQINWSARKFLSFHSNHLEKSVNYIFSGAKSRISNERSGIKREIILVEQLVKKRFAEEKHLLRMSEQEIRLIDPQQILLRGYTITMINGRALKNIASVNINDTITTHLSDGAVISKVSEIKKQ